MTESSSERSKTLVETARPYIGIVPYDTLNSKGQEHAGDGVAQAGDGRNWRQQKFGSKGKQIAGPSLDCSHFTFYMMHKAGYAIPYMSARWHLIDHGRPSTQARAYFDVIEASQIRADDLVLFPGHVGIAAGPIDGNVGSFIAANTSTGVAEAFYSVNGHHSRSKDKPVYYWGLNETKKPFLFALRPKAASKDGALLYDPAKATRMWVADLAIMNATALQNDTKKIFEKPPDLDSAQPSTDNSAIAASGPSPQPPGDPAAQAQHSSTTLPPASGPAISSEAAVAASSAPVDPAFLATLGMGVDRWEKGLTDGQRRALTSLVAASTLSPDVIIASLAGLPRVFSRETVAATLDLVKHLAPNLAQDLGFLGRFEADLLGLSLDQGRLLVWELLPDLPLPGFADDHILRARAQVGRQAWAGLRPGQRTALEEIVGALGSLPPDLVAAVKSGDNQAMGIAADIVRYTRSDCWEWLAGIQSELRGVPLEEAREMIKLRHPEAQFGKPGVAPYVVSGTPGLSFNLRSGLSAQAGPDPWVLPTPEPSLGERVLKGLSSLKESLSEALIPSAHGAELPGNDVVASVMRRPGEPPPLAPIPAAWRETPADPAQANQPARLTTIRRDPAPGQAFSTTETITQGDLPLRQIGYRQQTFDARYEASPAATFTAAARPVVELALGGQRATGLSSPGLEEPLMLSLLGSTLASGRGGTIPDAAPSPRMDSLSAAMPALTPADGGEGKGRDVPKPLAPEAAAQAGSLMERMAGVLIEKVVGHLHQEMTKGLLSSPLADTIHQAVMRRLEHSLSAAPTSGPFVDGRAHYLPAYVPRRRP